MGKECKVKKNINIAYIGGGSKAWARRFMMDLALDEDLSGEVRLYDIDMPSAERNRVIGNKIQASSRTRSCFNYVVSETLQEALTGADFVLISILPDTFREMRSDVHAPEAYGVWQSVGDTVGPGGVLRALRTVPTGALGLVRRVSDTIDLLSDGIAERSYDKVLAAFLAQPLLGGLSPEEGKELFEIMYGNVRECVPVLK